MDVKERNGQIELYVDGEVVASLTQEQARYLRVALAQLDHRNFDQRHTADREAVKIMMNNSRSLVNQHRYHTDDLERMFVDYCTQIRERSV